MKWPNTVIDRIWDKIKSFVKIALPSQLYWRDRRRTLP
uniref:Uncharacterized protein n=1 Tax=Arundo donax TaxID=35708 RepID=A0A0A9AD13_ARUDO